MFNLRILLLIVYSASALEQDINFLNSNGLQENENFLRITKSETHNIQEDKSIESEIVQIRLYYETLCPFSVEFYTHGFIDAVQKLSPYLNVTTNPYGNAKTYENDGKYTFKCQHGPPECYGNKLHACAIDVLKDMNKTITFNACMMRKGGFDGSNDETADECGKEQNIDSNPIKECAKSDKGSQILKIYGDASKEINLNYVPCIFINDKEEEDRDKFMEDICAEFKNPPPPCNGDKNN